MKKRCAQTFMKASIPILMISIFMFVFMNCNLPTTSRAAAPAAPAAPTLVCLSGQITASWTPVDKATSYEVWWNVADDTATAAKFGNDTVVTTTVISGAADGVTYWVWVKAKNRIGTSAFGASASVLTSPPTSPPAAPGAPTITPADTALGVSWTPVAGASAYEVWFNTVNNSATATQFGGDVVGASTTITGLANGTTYYVWVLAKNAVGNSAFSPSSSGVPQVGAPAAPGAPTLTPGDTVIDASWAAVGGATQYRVYTNTVNNSATATQFGTPVAGTNVTITGLTNGTLYYVWVQAENAGGLSGFSPSASATPQVAPPAAPGAPTLTPGDTQIGASWTAVGGATQYRVYTNTVNNSATATQFGAPVAGTNVTITGLANGTLYYVWVRAENAGGLSGFSPSASATPVAGPPAAPGAPTLTAGPTTADMGVSWGAVAGATLYRVYYNTINDSGTATEFGSGYAGTSTTINGLTQGTQYYVWVRAENAGGQSAFSTVSSEWTLPDPPATVTLTPGPTSTEMGASWSMATGGVTGYLVYYNTVNNSGTATQFGGPVGGLSTTITGLTPGTLYYVWVRSRNLGGDGPYSAASSATTIPAAPGAPGLTAGDSVLDATWGAVTGATLYRVYYNTIDDSVSSTEFGAGYAGLSTTITGLTNGTPYYVWVRAENAGGQSGYSPSSNATPMAGPPAAPAAPTLTSGETTMDATWGAVAGATLYRVYTNTIDDSASSTEFGAGFAGTSATITGLTANTVYYVWVRAENAGGQSGYSPSSSKTTLTVAPGAPVLTSGPANTEIGASWGAVAGATQYRVYTNTIDDSGTAAQFGAPVGGLSTTITGLATGTQYYVWVRAENAGGLSAFSASSNAWTIPADPGAPGLTPGDTIIDATWGAVTGATLYRVYTNTIDDSASSTEFGAGFAGTSATITGLTNGTPYYVWVRAENAGGQSGYSPSASATPQVVPPAAPGAPGLTPTGTTMDVTWGAVAGATLYRVYYNTIDDSASSTEFGAGFAGTSATITGLTNGTLYYVWVRAENAGGQSGYSPSSNATTIPAAPGAPTPAAGPSETEMGVSWGAVTGATLYRVYYNTIDDSGTATQFGAGFAGTNATVTGLTAGTQYYVWVTAENAAGQSGYSPSANAYTYPAAPIIGTITGGTQQIYFDWGAVTSADYYQVYYNTVNDSGTATQFGGSIAVTNATITGLGDGTLYYVWVRAHNTSGLGPYSTPGSAITIPAAPNAPTLTPGSTVMGVDWTLVTGAANYEVWYNTVDDSGTATQFGGDIPDPTNTTTITGLTNGTPYYVWVRAKNAGGTGPFSTSSSATPN
jgi:hypothetical protein